jgi:hypothetical protein
MLKIERGHCILAEQHIRNDTGMAPVSFLIVPALTLIFAALVLVCFRKRIWRAHSNNPKQAEMPGAHPTDSANALTFHYACESLAVFKHERGIRILQVASPEGPIDFKLSTRRTRGWGLPLEGISAEVRVQSITPSTAWQGSVDFLRDLVSVLSLSANVWVGEPRLLSQDESPESTTAPARPYLRARVR